jgi:hypothetical protein
MGGGHGQAAKHGQVWARAVPLSISLGEIAGKRARAKKKN